MPQKIDSAAQIHESVILEGEIIVGQYVTIEAGVVLNGIIDIGSFTKIMAGTVISGKVTVGHHCNIACNAVLRGTIVVGDWVHIYDLVLIEGGRPGNNAGGVTSEKPERSIIGNACWVNHGATMHGSRLEDGAVLDLNACLDYNCRIGKGSIVTNGSALHCDTVIPENCMVEGVPGKIIKRNITDDDRRERMGLVPAEWVKYAGQKYEIRMKG